MANIRYVFKEGEPLTFQGGDKANPQKIGEALAKIADSSGGHLIPNAVVRAAKNDDHPLHKHFEWRDGVAAEKYRLDQARALIRCVHVVSDKTEVGSVRAFLSIKGKSGVSYRTIDDVLTSADLQARVLAAAERDLLAFETRYRSLEDVCELLREVRTKIAEKRKQIEPGQATR